MQSSFARISAEESAAGILSDADTLARIQEIATEMTRISYRVKRLRPDEGDSRNPTQPTEGEEPKIIEIPRFRPIEGRPNESLAALQEWEGLVVSVKNGTMMAELLDITKGQSVREQMAEIPIAEVPEDERPRVVPGALFRWVIGYTRKAAGGLSRSSLIYFRRPPTRAASVIPPPMVFADVDD
jgi:hypothetical protein